jgi:hypothetical protein
LTNLYLDGNPKRVNLKVFFHASKDIYIYKRKEKKKVRSFHKASTLTKFSTKKKKKTLTKFIRTNVGWEIHHYNMTKSNKLYIYDKDFNLI